MNSFTFLLFFCEFYTVEKEVHRYVIKYMHIEVNKNGKVGNSKTPFFHKSNEYADSNYQNQFFGTLESNQHLQSRNCLMKTVAADF